MKFLLLTALLMSPPAMAFDRDAAIANYNEAWFACDEGQNHDGEPISEDAIKSACLDTVRLVTELKAEGYCLVRTNGEWVRCP